jgi:hypothetical protein
MKERAVVPKDSVRWMLGFPERHAVLLERDSVRIASSIRGHAENQESVLKSRKTDLSRADVSR